MNINLIQAIEKKGADIDGLTSSDKRSIEKRFVRNRWDGAKIKKVFAIFDDYVVEPDERKKLIRLLNLNRTARGMLSRIIGKEGWRLESLRFSAIAKSTRSDIPALITALKDKSAIVREDSAKALGRIGDQRAVPALMRAMNDKNVDARWQVLCTLIQLKKINHAKVRALLLLTMKEINARAAKSYQHSLRTPRFRPQILITFRNHHSRLKWWYRNLPIAALVYLLKNGDAAIRMNAKKALCHLKHSSCMGRSRRGHAR